MKSHKTRKRLSNHGLNGISLHSVGFESFKKVLLVALGVWLSKFSRKHEQKI